MNKKSKSPRKWFEGHFFKHFHKGKTVAFIPGISEEGGNIQVITDKKTFLFRFPEGQMGEVISIGDSVFSNDGIKVNLPGISGQVKYTNTTPLNYAFMGYLKYLPLECRHEIISIRHDLEGSITIEGEEYDLNGGVGYHEKDSGTQFPAKHLWVQCNNFKNTDVAIMLSIASVPILGIPVRGSICLINIEGKEHRLSTYLGALTRLTDTRIELRQFNKHIAVEILDFGDFHQLVSASNGNMVEPLDETNNAKMRFIFSVNGNVKFDLTSDYVGYERRHL